MKRFFDPGLVYLKISEVEISALDNLTKHVFKSKPFLLIADVKGRQVVQSVGDEMALKEKRAGVVWPFFGASGYIDEPDAAIALAAHCMRAALVKRRGLGLRPNLLVHFVFGGERSNGEEEKINPEYFKALIDGLGARRTYFKYGAEDCSVEALSAEIKSHSFLSRVTSKFSS